MNDAIRRLALEALEAFEGYYGEPILINHPVYRAVRRLQQSHGGRLPRHVDRVWRDLRAVSHDASDEQGDRTARLTAQLRESLRSMAGETAPAESEPLTVPLDDEDQEEESGDEEGEPVGWNDG